MTTTKAIKMIERRIEWLTKRIESAHPAKNLGYDKAERAGLIVAIEALKGTSGNSCRGQINEI